MTEDLSNGFTGIEVNGVRFSNLSEILQYLNKQREQIIALEKEVDLWKKASENNSYKAFQLEAQIEKMKSCVNCKYCINEECPWQPKGCGMKHWELRR